ncbi:MAG TPA: hypothetical protein VIJ54_06240 [Actinomycetes bacterium]
MCGDEERVIDGQHQQDPAGLLSRRSLLKGAGASAAALALLPSDWLGRTAVAAADTATDTVNDTVDAGDGLLPLSMAMHIHSSFSEQSGSMDSQLFQAAKNAVDVLWWTDHDYRMEGVRYRNVVHFTSLTAETTDGAAWQWQRQNTGSLTAASGGSIVQAPASPTDPIAGGALSVTAQSTSSSIAAVRFFAESHPAGWNYHRNLYGQTLTIEVLPTAVGAGGYLELLLNTSYHQAVGGRPAGVYSLSYRIGGQGTPGTLSSQGLQGIVNVAAPTGAWTSVSITPCEDLEAIWPELASTDFASFELRLGAVSAGAPTSGCFDYLRFTRAYATGDIPLQTQEELMERYAATYPDVTQRAGLEISEFLPHLNWFGGNIHLGDYTSVTYKTWQAFLSQQVGIAHTNGGLVSYNHPFGYTSVAALPASQQDSLRAQVAKQLLANRALGCDILEVGYPLRAGVDVKHHVALWDVLSRNALFLTGNGVSDDHMGQNWFGIRNNWVTSAWATSAEEADLLTALKAGRAWSASLARYRGTLDLLADGTAPMGSVTVSTARTRQLHVVATSLPAGSTLQLVRGTVDYAGAAKPAPNTSVVQSYPAARLASGSVDVAVDTSASRFLRTQVVGSDGVVIAVSNPIWLLRSAPPGGIPAPRAA